MVRPSVYTIFIAIVACKSGGTSDPNTCTPDVDYAIPPSCDDADCEDMICDATCPTGKSARSSIAWARRNAASTVRAAPRAA